MVLQGPYQKIENAVRESMEAVTLASMIEDFHRRIAASPSVPEGTEDLESGPEK